MTGGCPEPSGAARRTLSLKDATWREAEVALDTQQLSADHKTGPCLRAGGVGLRELTEHLSAGRTRGRGAGPAPASLSVTLTRAFGHSRRKTQPRLAAWGQGLPHSSPDTACWGAAIRRTVLTGSGRKGDAGSSATRAQDRCREESAASRTPPHPHLGNTHLRS